MSEIKPPIPMTARNLRDHLTRLIDDYDMGHLPVILSDTGGEIVNSRIKDGYPIVETWAGMKNRTEQS